MKPKPGLDTAEYAKQDFKKKKDAEADEGDEDLDGEGGVKQIILDEDGFWTTLVDALRIMTEVELSKFKQG